MAVKRWILGCGIGCAALIVLAVVAVIGFGVWINRPGPLLEPESLLGPDTRGYAEWTLDLDDPGTAGFTERLVRSLQEVASTSSGVLPPAIEGWLAGRRSNQVEEDVARIFPSVVAWTLEPGDAADSDLHVFTVSIASLGNQLVFGDWILGIVLGRSEDDVRVERFRGEKIYLIRTDRNPDRYVAGFIRDSDLFFTSDVDAARRTIDRLIDRASARDSGPPTELERRFLATTGTGSLRGAVSNENGEIRRLWNALPNAEELPSLDDLRGLTLTGGFREDGSMEGRLELYGPDAHWTAQNSDVFVAAIRNALAPVDFEYELEPSIRDERISVGIRIPDVLAQIE